MSEPQPYVPPPRKRRRYSKVNYPVRQYSFPDIPWIVPLTYHPCPHIHLQQRQYNRDLLTVEEHYNLLATPKGYRWYSRSENIIKRAQKGLPGKKRLLPRKPPFPGFKQFMAEIWDVLTPEMILRLKEILQEEFEMSSEDALEFLLEQRAKAERQARAEVLGPAPHVKGADICWARDVAYILADKVTKLTEMMTVTPRNRRTRKLRLHLIENLHQLVGLENEGPHSPVRALIYRAADILAVWLNSLPGEKKITKICDEFSTVYSTISLV